MLDDVEAMSGVTDDGISVGIGLESVEVLSGVITGWDGVGIELDGGSS